MLKKIFHYPGPLWWLQSLAAVVMIVLATIVLGSILIVGIPLGLPRKWQTRVNRLWNATILWSYGFTITIIRRDSVPFATSSLIVSNHQSLMDIPLVYAALPGDILMVAKEILFSIPFLGRSLKNLGFISIDRGNSTSGKNATEALRDRFRNNYHVWVAPEGTRSKTGEIAPFKKGSFAVAIEAKVPIQPLVFLNAREALPKNSFFVHTGFEMKVVVLSQVSTANYAIENRAALAEHVRNLIVAEMDAFQASRRAQLS